MKILIIEDEKALSESIGNYLTSAGFVCEFASDLTGAFEKVPVYDYDCILLDLMLPDGDGFKILERLRREGKSDGVIIISAKDTLETRIEGLSLGADDFLIKPFHLSELLARIQALIRRKNFKGVNIIKFNELEIDLNAKSVKVHEELIDLTKKEYDLLLYFLSNKNKLLSRAAIAEHLSGDMADMLDNHDFVYAHVKNLKKKLHLNKGSDYIKTVYGLGYSWTK
jgi:DNA-binding response OmpR family regulator